jgi:hypothetical protein
MSFGFTPIKWLDNGNTRTLKEVKLDEVSFGVTYAAYPETNSTTYMRGFMKRAIDIESINEILEKEEITEDEINKLLEVVKIINEVVEKNKPKEEQKEEAATEEQREEGTPNEDGTSEEGSEIEQKEEIKQEILALIDTLFDIEQEEITQEEEENEEQT